MNITINGSRYTVDAYMDNVESIHRGSVITREELVIYSIKRDGFNENGGMTFLQLLEELPGNVYSIFYKAIEQAYQAEIDGKG